MTNSTDPGVTNSTDPGVTNSTDPGVTNSTDLDLIWICTNCLFADMPDPYLDCLYVSICICHSLEKTT